MNFDNGFFQFLSKVLQFGFIIVFILLLAKVLEFVLKRI